MCCYLPYGVWQLASCHSHILNAVHWFFFSTIAFTQHIISSDVNNFSDDCHLSFVLNNTRKNQMSMLIFAPPPENWVRINLNKVTKKKYLRMDDMISLIWYDKWDVHWRQRRQYFLVGVAIFHIILNKKKNTVWHRLCQKKEKNILFLLTRNDKAQFMKVWNINFIRTLTRLTIIMPKFHSLSVEFQYFLFFFSLCRLYSSGVDA